jgi:CBS domain-containing protein
MVSDTLLPPRRSLSGDRLDTPVRDLMRPGVIVLSEHASVAQAQRAVLAHGVHAILVLEDRTGRPAGWVTSRGLLGWADRDVALACARDAITEPPVAVEPSAPAREALETIDRTGAARLLVARDGGGLPEGVVSDIDLLRDVSR